MAPGSLCPVSLSTESRVSPPGGGYGVWRCGDASLLQSIHQTRFCFHLSLTCLFGLFPIKCPQNLILQARCVVTDIACQVVTSAPSLGITCDGSGRTFVQTRPHPLYRDISCKIDCLSKKAPYPRTQQKLDKVFCPPKVKVKYMDNVCHIL